MKIFKDVPNFQFMNKRMYAFVLSGLIIVAGAFTFVTKGLNLGIDFSGGTMVEVSFKETRSEEDLRIALKDAGFRQTTIQRADNAGHKFFIKTMEGIEKKKPNQKGSEQPESLTDDEVTKLERISVSIDQALLGEEEKARRKTKLDLNNSSERRITNFLSSNGISIDLAKESAKKIIELTKDKGLGLIEDFNELEGIDIKNRVVTILKEKTFLGSFIFLSTEVVGPQVGRDLRKKATLATVWAMLGMLIYIGFRFRFIYGLAAVITLFHDILIAFSFILFFQVEYSLHVVAALLTIIGYSLNDTIVIFDRVRDNVKLMRRDNAEVILDKSVNQTLSRTMVTSLTTIIMVLSLYFLGGEVIHSFSFTLLIGVITGTYSSIFQSCAWLKIFENYFLGRKKTK